MIKLHYIEMLLAIERAGSIRAASKMLGKSQPAVTKALRHAESELGAAIFKRAPSGVAVTEEGVSILRRARVIQNEIRRMSEEIDQRRGVGTGRLSVTVSPLAAHRLIAGAIKRFHKKFPGVHIHITGGHEPMAFGPVRDGLVDLVIGPEPQGTDASGLSVQFLVETPISVITGAGSRWSNATELSELVTGDWLMIGTYERLPLLRRRFTELGLEAPEPKVTSDSIFSVLSTVQDSDYLCTFPELMLDHAVTKWRIVKLALNTPMRPARISIATSSERPMTPALQAFCDCIHQVAQNEFGQGI
ncbi:LysR family transcriptional regulator [Nioella sp.]|uniref:LysR family transcriptional regulator n=1 Tax=Nioella sp. TaxID=1912091 RepID=UPI003A8498CB